MSLPTHKWVQIGEFRAWVPTQFHDFDFAQYLLALSDDCADLSTNLKDDYAGSEQAVMILKDVSEVVRGSSAYITHLETMIQLLTTEGKSNG